MLYLFTFISCITKQQWKLFIFSFSQPLPFWSFHSLLFVVHFFYSSYYEMCIWCFLAHKSVALPWLHTPFQICWLGYWQVSQVFYSFSQLDLFLTVIILMVFPRIPLAVFRTWRAVCLSSFHISRKLLHQIPSIFHILSCFCTWHQGM